MFENTFATVMKIQSESIENLVLDLLNVRVSSRFGSVERGTL